MDSSTTGMTLVPTGAGKSQNLAAADLWPAILERSGPAGLFAAEEFFYGRIRNQHTRAAYLRAVKRFFHWAETSGLELRQITPGDVGRYMDALRQSPTSIATRKLHLAALRHFFDTLVARHVVVFNPALSVRGERYQVVEGRRPEITVDGARALLSSVESSTLVGLRDRAITAILIYTAARAGAVAGMQRASIYDEQGQWMLRLEEKGGKSRQIPARQDLQQILQAYLLAAGLQKASARSPLFPTAYRRTDRLTGNSMKGIDICRMIKRRLRDAGLSARLSPHSFRVTTITDLLEQGVPLEDVQHLAGHADPRTTRLYDRRDKRITRSIVDRISI